MLNTAVKPGQIVGAGSRLGSVGYSGRVFPKGPGGAHLHVSAIPKGGGTYINPIPYLAAGGIVKASTGGTLAVLGEARRDEAVIPLPPRLSGSSGLRALTETLTGAGPGVVNHWNVAASNVPTEEATLSAWRHWEALQAG
jgi:hypothetical protein